MPAPLRPLILIALLTLAGCGHKGPLYLPGQKPPAKSAPADPAPARP
jgi:predicted small lipoprotein YifL